MVAWAPDTDLNLDKRLPMPVGCRVTHSPTPTPVMVILVMMTVPLEEIWLSLEGMWSGQGFKMVFY